MRGLAARHGMGTPSPSCYAACHLPRGTASSKRGTSRDFSSGCTRATHAGKGRRGYDRARSAGRMSPKWQEGRSARTAGAQACPLARSPFARPTRMVDCAVPWTCDSVMIASFAERSTPSGGIAHSSAADLIDRCHEPAEARRLVRRWALPAATSAARSPRARSSPSGSRGRTCRSGSDATPRCAMPTR